MSSTWGPEDAHPGKDPDDGIKYDHLLPIGSSRMRQLDVQLVQRDARIKQLEADVDRLTNSNTELNDELVGMKSWRWIDSTYTLQRKVYGHVLPMRHNSAELADYAQVNLFAAIDEIMEMAGEIGWKPWASPRGWIRPQHVMKEAVDVLHFIANVLCAAGISDEEFWEAYRAKQATNTSRQELGYDGVSDKCPGCRRSYDDGINCAPAVNDDDENKLAFCTIEDMYIDPKE